MTYDPPALTGLDDIPWKDLRHARGNARDTPRYIRDLLSPKETKQQEALLFVEDSLCHQGYQIHDSTLAALPFLITLVVWPRLRVRGELSSVLVDIARGNGWFQGAVPLLGQWLPFDDGTVRDQLDKETELQRGIRKVILKHREVLLRLIEDPDAEVAISAAALAAAIGLDEPDVQRALRDCLEHSGATQRANALSAMAHTPTQGGIELLEACFRRDESELVRLAAALGLAAHDAPLNDEQKTVVLNAIDGRSEELCRQYIEFWFAAPMRIVCERMATRHYQDCQKLLPRLLESARRAKYVSEDRLWALLAFAAHPDGAAFVRGSLSIQQFDALTLLGDECWRSTSARELRPILEHFGLPTSEDTFSEFLRP